MSFTPFAIIKKVESEKPKKNCLEINDNVEYISNISENTQKIQQSNANKSIVNGKTLKETVNQNIIYSEDDNIQKNHSFINKFKGRSLKRVRYIEEDEYHNYEDQDKIFKSFGITNERNNEEMFEQSMEIQEKQTKEEILRDLGVEISEDENITEIPIEKPKKEKRDKLSKLVPESFVKVEERNCKFVGILKSLTPLCTYCYIEVDGIDVLRKVKIKNIKKISYEDYLHLKSKRKYQLNSYKKSDMFLNEDESGRKPKLPNPKSENILINQLFSNLIVKIVDKEFMNGKYFDETVIIEDGYGIDECMVTNLTNQWHVKGIKSTMIEPVEPLPNDYAKILKGEYKGMVVTVKDISDDRIANVEDEDDECFDISLDYLCSFRPL